jgi:hypothetical protein
MIRNPPLIESKILSRFEASKFPERLVRIKAGYSNANIPFFQGMEYPRENQHFTVFQIKYQSKTRSTKAIRQHLMFDYQYVIKTKKITPVIGVMTHPRIYQFLILLRTIMIVCISYPSPISTSVPIPQLNQ